MKKSYKINVDCANCANIIEDKINKIDGIEQANVNFMLQKLNVKYKDNANPDEVLEQIQKEAKKVESDFEIEI